MHHTLDLLILWWRGSQVYYIATETPYLVWSRYHLYLILRSSHIRRSGTYFRGYTDVCKLYVTG